MALPPQEFGPILDLPLFNNQYFNDTCEPDLNHEFIARGRQWVPSWLINPGINVNRSPDYHKMKLPLYIDYIKFELQQIPKSGDQIQSGKYHR